MKFKIIYFDDLAENIDVYGLMLKENFNVVGFTDPTLFQTALQHKPHGILLDLHMPKEDGLSLYNKILESKDYNGCPIFFISGDINDENRLKSMKLGAMDFFDRFICEAELKLRMMSRIKIYLQGSVLINVGNLELDSDNFSIQINGKSCDLTLIETRILIYLIKALPELVEKSELIFKIWGETSTKGKINVHLSNMKIKLWNWDHEIRLKDSCLSIMSL